MQQGTVGEYVKRRVAKYLIPEEVFEAGVSKEEFVKMENFLLDLTGQRETAYSNIMPLADQVLFAAKDTAVLAIANKLLSADALAGLPEFWKKDWRYAYAVKHGHSTQPTFKQLNEIMGVYAAQQSAPPPPPLHTRRQARQDEDDFVPSELDRRKASTRSD